MAKPIAIAEALAEADALEPNDFTPEEKLRWLSRLDGRAFEQVIGPREGGIESFEGYGPDTDPETALLIPEPHGAVYTSYLLAQIALYRQENDLYNDHMSVHQDAWDAWAAHYAQRHRQRACGRILF